MIRFFWILCFTTIWCLSAKAAKLSTDLMVFVPKNVAQTVAGTVTGSYQYSTPALTIPGAIPIGLENMDLALTYQLQTLNLRNAGAFDANLAFIKVRAKAAKLKIDAVTEKIIDGVVVRVKIKVDCTNAVMENRSLVPATGAGQVSNNPLTAKLDSLNWNATGQEWQFSAEKCEGNTDAAEIETQINNFFSQSAELKKDVLEKTNTQIAEWLQNNRTWAKQFPEFNSVISTRADEILDNGKSWVLRLAVEMTPLMSCPSFVKEPRIASPATAPGPSGVEMQINNRVVSVVAQCLHEMGHLYRRDMSKQMPGFRDFMQSSLKKFLYWGDLLRFPVDSDFVFLSKTVGPFAFEPVESTKRQNERGTSIFFEGQGTVESQMKYVSGEGDPSPYVTFFTDVRGQMSLDTKYEKPQQPTQFVIRTRGEPSSRMTYRWDVRTDVLRDPGINAGVMKDEIMKTLKSSKLQFQLEPVVMTDSHQINVVGIRNTDSLIQLQLQVNPRQLNTKGEASMN